MIISQTVPESGMNVAEAGDVTVTNNAGNITTNSTTWAKLRTARLMLNGTYRCVFALKRSGGDAGMIAYAVIYRNGKAVGTVRENDTTSGETFSEDIDGWTGGDEFHLYGKVSNGAASSFCSDVAVKMDRDPSFGAMS